MSDYKQELASVKEYGLNDALAILQAFENSNLIQAIKSIAKPVYTNKELMELLGVKDNTLRFYRDEGYLGYSRFKDKIWYTLKDVTDFLHHPKFRHEPVLWGMRRASTSKGYIGHKLSVGYLLGTLNVTERRTTS